MGAPPDALAGRLLLADLPSTSVTPEVRALLAAHRPGGVVLFEKNVETPAQAAALCADLQAAAAEIGLPPLLIAVDQEGGTVERLPLGMPGAMAFGAAGSPASAERAGALTGRALRRIGVNVNFAPVLDVNTNPDNPVIGIRAFGDDPAHVASLGLAYLRGLQREGVLATGKHFPGHGDTALDSHLDLPVLSHAMERLETVELAPFRAVAPEAAALMTAHVVLPSMGMTPATLSPALLDGLLRRRWGFEGIVFTDSLAMAAITGSVGAARAAVLALLAGADGLLALGGEAALAEVSASVRRALADGVLSTDRLEQAARRIERALRRVAPPQALEAAAGPGAAREAAAAEAATDPAAEIASFAREVAAAAITLIRNGPRTVPLARGPVAITEASPRGDAARLGAALRRLRPDLAPVVAERAADAEARLGESGAVVVLTHGRGRPAAEEIAAVRRLQRLAGARLAVVATGTPYDLAALPDLPCYLATYGREPVMLDALATVLAGTHPPRGRLPVAIPGCHPWGWGIVW